MKLKLLILVFILIASAGAMAQTKPATNGYYFYRMPDTLNPYKYYLRFYNDGTVITVTTAGKVEKLIPWFNKDHRGITKGKYTLKGSYISFYITSDAGQVDYEGELVNENLRQLKVKSRINNYEGTEIYNFLKIEGLK